MAPRRFSECGGAASPAVAARHGRASSSRPTRRTRNTSCSRPAATLNARERSGDATSSDERRRDSEARAKPVLRSSTSALLREPARLRERCRWLALSPERRAQRRRVSRTGAGASRYCPRCEPLLPTLPMGGVVPHQNPLHKLRDRDRRSQHIKWGGGARVSPVGRSPEL